MAAAKSPSAEAHPDREVLSMRHFAANPEQLFAAFSDPDRLEQWWGPKDFTSTIQQFDLRPGGKWRLVLHGPDGADYPNEKEFVEVTRPTRIVFRHIDPTHGFLMTITHTAESRGTAVTWSLLFDSAAECAKIRTLVTEANEQNFDRLEKHLTTSS